MFTLAETIGGHTVEELSKKMSVSEQAEWAKYFEIKDEEREKAKKEAKKNSGSNKKKPKTMKDSSRRVKKVPRR